MISERNLSGQLRAVDGRLLPQPRRCRPTGDHDRVVAALLSRHGSDAGRHRADPRRVPGQDHEPARVPGSTRPVDPVAGHQPQRVFGRPELRLRTRRPQDLRRGPRGPEPGRRADHRHRQRARPPRHAEALRRPIRQVRLLRAEDHPVLRHGRGDGLRVDDGRGRRPEDHRLPARQAGRGDRRADDDRRGHRADQLRRAAFATRADRRRRDPQGSSGGDRRRDLDAR